ncbi:MAG: NifB/NifX family molybdenum-iron cluster-binding protein [candidate division WOR-3 bacterium]|nr:NifB/NifX family molybdenum-iron cluster-binding protein [candidate division WOR-3 bacterium]
MIISFASDDEKGLDGVLAYHFGRCLYFTFVEVEGDRVKNVKVEKNPYLESHESGAIPKYIKEKGAEMIFAGGMGPKAQNWFSELGIKPIAGAYGKIQNILDEYLGSQIPTQEHKLPHKEKELKEERGEEVERIKKELAHLRAIIAEMNERLRKIE